jgi:hypothetical protein
MDLSDLTKEIRDKLGCGEVFINDNRNLVFKLGNKEIKKEWNFWRFGITKEQLKEIKSELCAV